MIEICDFKVHLEEISFSCGAKSVEPDNVSKDSPPHTSGIALFCHHGQC